MPISDKETDVTEDLQSLIDEGIPDPSNFIEDAPKPTNGEHVQPSTSFVTPPVEESVSVEDSTVDDSTDEVFDPAIHAAGPTGEGIRTKSGRFRLKPGRRNTRPVVLDTAELEARAASDAAMVTGMIIALGQAMGDEEGLPIQLPEHGYDEARELQSAYQKMFMETGTLDLPPWFLVAFTTGQYFIRRAGMPKTQTTWQKLWGWFNRAVDKVKEWFGYD